MKVKILLFGHVQTFQELRLHLRDDDIDIVAEVTDENMVLDEISRATPDIVLVTEVSPMTLRACQQIYLLRPRSIPVVVSDASDALDIARIVETGVHYIISPQLEPLAMTSELKGIYASEANRIMALENSASRSSKSRVVMVFGSKGGIGCSTLAVNLAVKLARQKNRVAILDYNFQFGTIGSLLKLSSRNTIAELLSEQSNPNADMIRQFMVMHSSGVNVLLAPNNPEDGATITASQAERIISTLRMYYDYLIVDAPPELSDITTSTLDAASRILYLTMGDVLSIENTKKGLGIVEALADREKINIVLRRRQGSKIKSADISRVLGHPIWHELPDEPNFADEAINQGNPLVLSFPRSKTAKSYDLMGRKFMDRPNIADKASQKAVQAELAEVRT